MRLLEPLERSATEDCRPQPGHRPALLIVDDEAGPRESLKIIFEDDYEVVVAEGGHQALELLKQHAVNAAVLDIRMGAMSGIELLNRIKQHDPDVGVIMLTAFEELETIRQALRLGACDYLSKPFDLSTMRAAVAKAIERNRCARQVRSNQEALRELHSQLTDFQLKEEIARKRGEIYGIVLHDINSPLTVISSLATVASEQLRQVSVPAENSLAAVKEELAQIDQQVRKCLEISRRYLGFARRQPAAQPAVRVNQVLSDLGMLLRPHPSLAGNELQLFPLPEEMLVQIHGTDLIQILLNLCINAFQATAQPHRVQVTARRLAEPFDQARFRDGPHAYFVNRLGFTDRPPLVEICIQDDGPGISVVPLEKVFEAFFTTKPAGEGTGLGLSIVLHLVEQARAGLFVESAPGQGTSFRLLLQGETPEVKSPDRTSRPTNTR
jgi:two-component system, sensor histidine kinase and response regulator